MRSVTLESLKPQPQQQQAAAYGLIPRARSAPLLHSTSADHSLILYTCTIYIYVVRMPARNSHIYTLHSEYVYKLSTSLSFFLPFFRSLYFSFHTPLLSRAAASSQAIQRRAPCARAFRYQSCFLTYIRVCILAQRDSLKGVFEKSPCGVVGRALTRTRL